MIYCSYSRKDRQVVQRVCRSLTEKGVQLFVDYEQLAGGDYAQELTKQIESAEAILFFYSENTENSTWVKHEIEFSLSKNKRIIPILLSEPKNSSWLHFNLGSFNWIKFDDKNINSIADKIINVLSTLNQRGNSVLSEAKRNIDDNGLLNAPKTDKSKGASLFRNKKKYGCGIIVILSLIALFLLFPPFYVGSPNPSYIPSPTSYDSISSSNMDYGLKDSTVLKQREFELKSQVDEQLLNLLREIDNPSAAGHGNYSQSIIHNIELILGEDSIPFPQDGINTPQGRLNAFHKYQETVYSVLKKRIAEMELEARSCKDIESIHEQEDPDDIPCDSVPQTVFSVIYLLISFLMGCGLMFLLLRKKKSKKDNIKLSSDIASRISIDGDLQKEIEAREVYTTHLENGEYLIDFEDRQDENRHKTFNHEVTAKDCKLVFANFLEESSQNGKTIKCFIAGSKTLQQERDALRAVTCVMYNKWDSKNFRILSYTFEDFKKEHTLVPPQELYNKFIEEEADWALFIIDGEVGGITVNEYRVAMDSFKKNGKPKILALAKVGSENNEKVAEIRDEINKEHQYWTDYTDIVSLKYIFESTLNWDLIRMFQDK